MSSSLAQKGGHVVRHGLGFALAKGSVLLAPLLAAKLWTVSDYGNLEWWLAVSTVAGSALTLGSPSLVAFEAVSNKPRLTDVATIYVVAMACLTSVVAILAWASGSVTTTRYAIPIVLAAQVALQLTLAAYQKGEGKGAIASFSESGVYLILLVTIALHSMGFPIGSAILLISITLQVVISVRLLRPIIWRDFPGAADWRSLMSVGPQVMMASFIFMLMTTGARLLIGHFDGDAVLAEYALSYRWLTIAIVAHQFVGTVFFRNIYSTSYRDQERRMLLPVIGVTLLSAAITVIVWLSPDFPVMRSFPVPGMGAHGFIIVLAAAMPLWSAAALMEGILYREGMPLRLIGALLAGLLTMLATYTLCKVMGMAGPLAGSAGWFFGLIVTVFLQIYLLRHIGIRLPRLFLFLIGIIAIAFVAQLSLGGALNG